MPEAIHYCDRCRKIIPPADIKAKAAFVRDEVSYCATCVATLSAEEKAALDSSKATQRKGPQHARPSASRRRHKTPPAAKKAFPAVILAAGAGVGLVAGFVVMVMLLGGDGEPAKTPSTALPAPGAPMPPPAPAVRTPPSPAPAAPAEPAPAPSPAPEPAASEALAAVTRMQKEDEEKRNRPLRPEEIAAALRQAQDGGTELVEGAAGGVEVINDFETEHDLKMFSSKKGSVSLSRQHVTHGVTSMRVDAGTYLGGWPIVNYRRDWSGYDSLRIDIYNDTGGPAKVLIRVWDEESATGGDQEYWNRHNSGKTLREGANVFAIDLHDLYRGESGKRNTITGRNIDLDKIKRFDLGFKGTQGAFYLDTVRLVKAARQ